MKLNQASDDCLKASSANTLVNVVQHANQCTTLEGKIYNQAPSDACECVQQITAMTNVVQHAKIRLVLTFRAVRLGVPIIYNHQVLPAT